MATNVAPIMTPDVEAIQRHLEALFSDVPDQYAGGLLEIAYGTSKPDHAAYFECDADGIATASAFAAEKNRNGQNLYVGANPRKPATQRNARGSDTDVDVAFYQFADLDSADAVAGLRSKMPLLPTLNVITGIVPNVRPHLYWKLEEPVFNMAEWTKRQRGIAQTLGGDAVINPSRIMRLGGTVNYPSPDKVGRGYRVGLTTVRTDFAEERSPVSPDEIAKAFPAATHTALTLVGDGQTTLSAMSHRTHISDLLASCRQPVNWHNNMVRLTGHLAALGRSTAEMISMAASITLPGYSVDQTIDEMRIAIEGARRKWALPEPVDSIEAEEAQREEADSVFETLDLDALEALPAPTYLIEGVLPDKELTILWGEPGAGKSFIALDMALRLAYGMDWHGTEARQCGVLYIAGEGKHGLGKRVKGWRRDHGMEGVDAPFRLIPVAVQLLDNAQRAKLIRTLRAAVEAAGFAVELIIVDTVSRSIAGQDENKQDTMSLFVNACAEVQAVCDGALIGVHHAGKDKERGMRGSSVLLGACSTSIKISKDGETVKLETEKQKDDEASGPYFMEMRKTEWVAGLEKPISTLVPYKAGKPLQEDRTLSRRDADKVFDEVDRAWIDKNPWSPTPQSRDKGRYLPSWIRTEFNVSEGVAMGFIRGWLEREYMALESYERSSRAKGLRVVKRLEQDQ